jgi:hypothetical protein
MPVSPQGESMAIVKTAGISVFTILPAGNHSGEFYRGSSACVYVRNCRRNVYLVFIDVNPDCGVL